MDTHIYHHGIKGQKWGVRRYQEDNGTMTPAGRKRYSDAIEKSQQNETKEDIDRLRKSSTRTLKRGTEIQNISENKLDSNNKKSNRLYGSYTEADKVDYIDTMGNIQYDGHGWKNTFVVKDDIKIASEKEVVRTLAEMFKENPKQVSEMMATAYNAVHEPIIFFRTKRGYEKKLNKLLEDPDSAKSIKLGRDFLNNIPMTDKTSDIANDFYTRMVKKGFDAVMDPNDANNSIKAQDPLIIFNMSKLGDTKSVELTEDDLNAAFEYTISKDFRNKKKDYSSVAHSIFAMLGGE